MINILDFCQFINETLTNFPMLKKHHSTPYPNHQKAIQTLIFCALLFVFILKICYRGQYCIHQ